MYHRRNVATCTKRQTYMAVRVSAGWTGWWHAEEIRAEMPAHRQDEEDIYQECVPEQSVRTRWGKMDLLQRGDSGKWFWTRIENNVLGKFQYYFSFPGLKLYPTKVYSHYQYTVFQSWWHYFLVGKSPTWYYSGFYFLLLILAYIYFTLYNYFHFTNIYLMQSLALSRNVYSVKSYSHPYIHSIFISLNPNSLVYTKKKVDF